MTDSQKIERLAEFMGFGFAIHSHGVSVNTNGSGVNLSLSGVLLDKIWNPLTDWNHWRQVEEKVIYTPDLNLAFTEFFGGNNTDEAVTGYIQSSLPVRVDFLLAALDSLSAK